MARSRIAARLARRWRASPDTPVRAIVRTVADLDETATVLEQRGLTVTRRYNLLPVLAISGLARDVLSLSEEDWITSVEEDQQVRVTEQSMGQSVAAPRGRKKSDVEDRRPAAPAA